MAFSVVGYDIGELLGFGAFGEVWAARDLTSGCPVALRRVRVTDVGRRAQVHAAAAVLTGVTHPHLVRQHGVVATDDSVVLVLDHVTGGSLARHLERHGRLTPGEIVTLAVPLAQALAVVHERGLLHGGLTPSAVLLTAEGMPVLSDCGLARLLSLASDGTAADDVRDLAGICWTALAGAPPDTADGRSAAAAWGPAEQRLAAALEAALSADPARRPAAEVLAAAIYAAAPPAPLRFAVRGAAMTGDLADPTGPSPGARHRAVTGSRRRAGTLRGWALVALGGATLTMAALSGLAWAGADPGSPAARPPAPAASPDAPVRDRVHPSWAAVLARLDARRADAFEAGEADLLDGVYSAGSPARRRDRARLGTLVAAGLRAQSLHLRARSVTVRREDPARTLLRVVDVLDPYDLRDAAGALAQHRPGRGATSWLVTLVREPAGWRIYDVVAS